MVAAIHLSEHELQAELIAAARHFGVTASRFCIRLPSCLAKEKPPAVSCRGFSWSVVRRTELPVTLSAEKHANSILVLELVRCSRLGRDRREHNRARVLLIEVGPENIGRERQVLDRG